MLMIKNCVPFYEKSCGSVLFKRSSQNELLFLTVKYKGSENYWGLVKGHVERNEEEIETAIRETYEEVGLKDIQIIRGFRELVTYQPSLGVTKLVVFFLVEAGREPIQFFAGEHTDYGWLPFDNVVETLTYSGDKRVISSAMDYLQHNSLWTYLTKSNGVFN